jgi:hypothetical protein
VQLADRMGIAGLILALAGIAVSILWPDKKWIGWLAFCLAGVLVLWWGWVEVRPWAINIYRNYPVKSTLLVFMCGGIVASSLWIWLTRGRATITKSAESPPSAAGNVGLQQTESSSTPSKIAPTVTPTPQPAEDHKPSKSAQAPHKTETGQTEKKKPETNNSAPTVREQADHILPHQPEPTPAAPPRVKSPRLHLDSDDPFIEFQNDQLVEWGEPLVAQMGKAVADWKAEMRDIMLGPYDKNAKQLLIKSKNRRLRQTFMDCCYENAIMYRKELVTRVFGGDTNPNIHWFYDSLTTTPPDDRATHEMEIEEIAKDLRELMSRVETSGQHSNHAQTTAPSSSPRGGSSPPAQPTEIWDISDAQRAAIKSDLLRMAGSDVRLLILGPTQRANVVHQVLIDLFTGWNIQNWTVGQGPLRGDQFYLTATDISSKLATDTYAIFARYGVNLPLVPNAYQGPLGDGPARGIVIVVQ